MKGILLFRIDDRLIHGQVVIGWTSVLNSNSILLCDDSVYEKAKDSDFKFTKLTKRIPARNPV